MVVTVIHAGLEAEAMAAGGLCTIDSKARCIVYAADWLPACFSEYTASPLKRRRRLLAMLPGDLF